MDSNLTDLGLVTNLAFAEAPDTPGTFVLKLHLAGDAQKNIQITEGAARLLWFHLTEVLFPGAAKQVTARAATVALAPPASLSVVFAVKVVERRDGLIEIVAVSTLGGWTMRLTHDEGEELWTCLQQTLRTLDPGKA